MNSVIDKLVPFFEGMRPESIARLGEFYAPDLYFKDPFNEVRGVVPLQRIFSHMYETLDQPRFVVTGRVEEGNQCFLTWDFEFRFKNSGKAPLQTIRGCSHLKINDAGLIDFHRDYWDAAEELYEKLPIIGSLMRWLRRKISAET
ncbi:MAG TPA: nuclear transport factor 2 family protein [Polaromonas sp.]|uniref:nuclear transport factor 2 family protein n=1 Tax=Polaromonas sp. TaxID=1869339 RepID=UPI002D239FF2|nr:nuclear transport factor 2 family protein [Polaromonas sp.]HYW56946.1 nuclear transport factor 2 family protein [Polaromonas sp.]